MKPQDAAIGMDPTRQPNAVNVLLKNINALKDQSRRFALIMIRFNYSKQQIDSIGEILWSENLNIFKIVIEQLFHEQAQVIVIEHSFLVLLADQQNIDVIRSMGSIRNELDKCIPLGMTAEYNVIGDNELNFIAEIKR